ncbi:hypothetical protein [Corallococcus exercitus]|uniref:hypothetical protein n=1 Tax=Corallococcus exercitus TaxID=2316736 RepID=UPI0013152F7F|nr:hypothetical protein [Corallococcus exercitus]
MALTHGLWGMVFCLCLLLSLPAGAAEAPPGTGPRKVYVSFALTGLSSVDDVNETFDADFYMRLRWYDPTLANAPLGNLDAPPAWRPNLEIINAKSVSKQLEEDTYQLVAPGIVQTVNRYRVTLASKLDLRRFPFDEQDLPILVEDFQHSTEELVLVHERVGARLQGAEALAECSAPLHGDDVLELASSGPSEWELHGVHVGTGMHRYTFFDDIGYSRFNITLHVERRPQYYVFKLILVLLLLVLAPCVVFFLDPESLGERSGICITALLAVIAHNYIACTVLPRIAYLCVMDYFMFGGQAVLFLIVVESLCVHQVVKRTQGTEYESRGLRFTRALDRVCLYSIPPALLLAGASVYALYA